MAESQLVLASASPRRQELIRLLGIEPRVVPQDIDEAAFGLADPSLSALSIASAKARHAIRAAASGTLVLAADTVVVHLGRALGKPSDQADAASMLRSLRGGLHQVATAVVLALVGSAREWSALVSTGVWMRSYRDEEIEAYVARHEPFDKAGGYAIQDTVFAPVEGIDGCFLNVVGLPLCAVRAGLETLGAARPIPAASPLTPPCDYCRRSGLMPGSLVTRSRADSGPRTGA